MHKQVAHSIDQLSEHLTYPKLLGIEEDARPIYRVCHIITNNMDISNNIIINNMDIMSQVGTVGAKVMEQLSSLPDISLNSELHNRLWTYW